MGGVPTCHIAVLKLTADEAVHAPDVVPLKKRSKRIELYERVHFGAIKMPWDFGMECLDERVPCLLSIETGAPVALAVRYDG